MLIPSRGWPYTAGVDDIAAVMLEAVGAEAGFQPFLRRQSFLKEIEGMGVAIEADLFGEGIENFFEHDHAGIKKVAGRRFWRTAVDQAGIAVQHQDLLKANDIVRVSGEIIFRVISRDFFGSGFIRLK